MTRLVSYRLDEVHSPNDDNPLYTSYSNPPWPTLQTLSIMSTSQAQRIVPELWVMGSISGTAMVSCFVAWVAVRYNGQRQYKRLLSSSLRSLPTLTSCLLMKARVCRYFFLSF